MIITEIKLKNIGPFRGAHEISFKKGLNVIHGKIGSGKTFILESWFAACYGSWLWRKDSLYEYVSSGQKSGEIIAEFCISEKKYRVERVITSSRTGTCKIFCDNSLVAGPKVKDSMNYISDLIGEKDMITASMMLSQNRDGDFTDSNASDKRAIISKMLNLDKISEIKKIISSASDSHLKMIDDLERQKEKYEALLEAKIEDRKRVLSKLKDYDISENASKQEIDDKIESIKEEIVIKNKEKEKMLELQKILKSKHDSIIKKDNILQNEYYKKTTEAKTKLNHFQNSLKDKIEKIKRKISKKEILEKKIKEKNEYLTSLKSVIFDEKEFNKYNDIIEKIKKESDLLKEKKAIENRIESLEKIIKNEKKAPCIDINPEIIQKCHYASSYIKIKNEYSLQKRKLNAKEVSISILRINLSESEKEKIFNHQKELEKAKKNIGEIKQIENIINENKIEIEEINSEIKKTKKIIENEKKEMLNCKEKLNINKPLESPKIKKLSKLLEDLSSRFLEINKQIQSKQNDINGINDIIKDSFIIQNESFEISDQLNNSDLQIKESEKKKNALKKLELAFGNKGIPVMLIKKSKQFIEKLINEMFEKLLDSPWRIEIILQKEKNSGGFKDAFDLMIWDGKTKRSIDSFSGGERTIVATVSRFAMIENLRNSIGKHIGVFLIDEPFASLDSESKILMIQILKNVTSRFEQIICVSHSDELFGYSDVAIRISKKVNNISIEYE